jgi:hypothetical protein
MSQIEESLLAVEKELKKVRKGLKKVQKMRATMAVQAEVVRHNKSPEATITVVHWNEDTNEIDVQKIKIRELTLTETMDVPPKFDFFGRRIEGLCCPDALDIRCIHQS